MSIKCDGAVHVDSQALSFEPCDLAPKAVQHESSSTSPRVPNLANLDSVVFFISLPSVLWHCWLGDGKGIQPVKCWVSVCWWWHFDWSFARLMAPVVTTHNLHHP